eukprot:TRINITY_DN2313_c0_g1_i1.p2 TRINITY_DN2313_c0_g1~~TRINITY_DN2313_c0_g1_i1.p2  ORF type:complete len:103 (+),score=35.58 TRINITY_DN2313_c0_g1_i1:118-426(+)
MIRRPPRSTQSRSSAASDVYKRQGFHCFCEGFTHHCATIDVSDEVTTLDASFISRSIVNRGNDFYDAIFHLNFDTKASILTFHLHTHLLVHIGVQVSGVWVK